VIAQPHIRSRWICSSHPVQPNIGCVSCGCRFFIFVRGLNAPDCMVSTPVGAGFRTGNRRRRLLRLGNGRRRIVSSTCNRSRITALRIPLGDAFAARSTTSRAACCFRGAGSSTAKAVRVALQAGNILAFAARLKRRKQCLSRAAPRPPHALNERRRHYPSQAETVLSTS